MLSVSSYILLKEKGAWERAGLEEEGRGRDSLESHQPAGVAQVSPRARAEPVKG